MEIEKLNQKYKEWIITVRLAHYKRLSISTLPLEDNEKELLDRLTQMLLEDGYTMETLDYEVLNYKKLSEEERIEEIEEKVRVLVSQINSYLENDEEISSIDYPELYHRIQELVALNSTAANELIKKAFENENIYHCMSCGDSLYGISCTYYFSKKLTYK